MDLWAVPSLVMELRAVLLYRRVDDGQVVNSTSGVDHQTAAPCVPAVQRQAGPVHALLLSWAHRRWVAERSNLLLSVSTHDSVGFVTHYFLFYIFFIFLFSIL